jgi:hypothetical protein
MVWYIAASGLSLMVGGLSMFELFALETLIVEHILPEILYLIYAKASLQPSDMIYLEPWLVQYILSLLVGPCMETFLVFHLWYFTVMYGIMCQLQPMVLVHLILCHGEYHVWLCMSTGPKWSLTMFVVFFLLVGLSGLYRTAHEI